MMGSVGASKVGQLSAVAVRKSTARAGGGRRRGQKETASPAAITIGRLTLAGLLVIMQPW
jgi:hypothetical protein